MNVFSFRVFLIIVILVNSLYFIMMPVVVEHAYHLANASHKRSLLVEIYSTELQLFQDLTKTNSGR